MADGVESVRSSHLTSEPAAPEGSRHSLWPPPPRPAACSRMVGFRCLSYVRESSGAGGLLPCICGRGVGRSPPFLARPLQGVVATPALIGVLLCREIRLRGIGGIGSASFCGRAIRPGQPCPGQRGASPNDRKCGPEPPDHVIGRSRGGLAGGIHRAWLAGPGTKATVPDRRPSSSPARTGPEPALTTHTRGPGCPGRAAGSCWFRGPRRHRRRPGWKRRRRSRRPDPSWPCPRRPGRRRAAG